MTKTKTKTTAAQPITSPTLDPSSWDFARCHAYLVARGHITDHGTADDATDGQQMAAVRDLVLAVADVDAMPVPDPILDERGDKRS